MGFVFLKNIFQKKQEIQDLLNLGLNAFWKKELLYGYPSDTDIISIA